MNKYQKWEDHLNLLGYLKCGEELTGQQNADSLGATCTVRGSDALSSLTDGGYVCRTVAALLFPRLVKRNRADVL